MSFDDVEVVAAPIADEPPELAWLDDALTGQARAVLWEAPPGLSVPRSYRRYPRFDLACAEFAARGLPVRVRRTGGGVVPQGPGILNLSLAWCPAAGPAEGGADDAYRMLCTVLAQGLGALGIPAHTAAVTGSFCDGRYNLAVDGPAGARKIAGTAQYWRRHAGQQAVLAHALLLVKTNRDEITARASAFEVALGSDVRYVPGAITDVAHEWECRHAGAVSEDLWQRIVGTLTTALQHTETP